MEKCGTVVPQSNFQKRVIRQRIDCNTQMRNVIESSKGKEPAATPSRSQAPFQGAACSKQFISYSWKSTACPLPLLASLAAPSPCSLRSQLPPPQAGSGIRPLPLLASLAAPSPASGVGDSPPPLLASLAAPSPASGVGDSPPPSLASLAAPAPPAGGKITLQYRAHRSTD